MALRLTGNDRARIFELYQNDGLPALMAALDALANEGHDVAGVPFRLVDHLLSNPDVPVSGDLSELGRLLPAGQPKLFRAILAEILEQDPDPLVQLAHSASTHPKTRWEAFSWQVFSEAPR